MWQTIVLSIIAGICLLSFLVSSGKIENINQLKNVVYWGIATVVSSIWLAFYLTTKTLEMLLNK